LSTGIWDQKKDYGTPFLSHITCRIFLKAHIPGDPFSIVKEFGPSGAHIP